MEAHVAISSKPVPGARNQARGARTAVSSKGRATPGLMATSIKAGPRATGVFLLVTGVLFAVLLAVLGWRAHAAGVAAWLLVAAVIVGVLTLVAAAFFARGVGEGRL